MLPVFLIFCAETQEFRGAARNTYVVIAHKAYRLELLIQWSSCYRVRKMQWN